MCIQEATALLGIFEIGLDWRGGMAGCVVEKNVSHMRMNTCLPDAAHLAPDTCMCILFMALFSLLIICVARLDLLARWIPCLPA